MYVFSPRRWIRVGNDGKEHKAGEDSSKDGQIGGNVPDAPRDSGYVDGKHDEPI